MARYFSVLMFLFLTTLKSQINDSTSFNLNSLKVSKGKPGIKIESEDKKFSIKINLRSQFRAATPFESDPTKLSDFEKTKITDFRIRRARFKVSGNAYKPWVKYKLEYDFVKNRLLDFYFKLEKYPFAKLQIGRWKADYSREKIISSGKQQLIERSLINRPFTIDRQNGISLYGDIDGPGSANFNYWASAFVGTGIAKESNDDSNLMYMLKTQWNINGRKLDVSGSDLKYYDKFTSIISIGGVTNKSEYTRFSGGGGSQLEGFEDGVAGQYRINQYMIESAFKYRGWSWQQEYHWKEIKDEINNSVTNLTGNYAQIGYFPFYSLNFIPKNLELFGRHSFFNPNLDLSNNNRYEYTLGANWFFDGHRNKLSLEYSNFKFNQIEPNIDGNTNRIRLQWDISF